MINGGSHMGNIADYSVLTLRRMYRICALLQINIDTAGATGRVHTGVSCFPHR
jgi:hypothetical protein